MNSPEVLFLTIYYNRQDFVEASVQSMLNQSYDNLKIIIVDDCSTDNTTATIEKTICNDKRALLIKNEKNKGFTNNIIEVINEHQCDYIAIHGAGDISSPDRIAEQVRYLERHKEVGAVSTRLTNVVNSEKGGAEVRFHDQLRKNNITHGSVMFRRTVYEKVGGYRSFFTTRQDKDLWFRMALVTKIHILDKQLYTLVSIKNSVSGTAHRNPLPLYLSVFARELALERRKTGTDALDRYGQQGALLFNKKKSISLIVKLMTHSLIRMKFKRVYSYLSILYKVVFK